MARQESENRPGSQAIEQGRRTRDLLRSENWPTYTPFAMMRRIADEMDRMFEGFGPGSSLLRSRLWNESGQFSPQIDIFERDGKMVVRADLPGMTRENVNVDITDHAVVIHGERKYEHESNEQGVYRTERSYGTFHREVPLPEGVKPETASAKFKDGVLEVTIDAPQSATNRRRVEIQGEEPGLKGGKSAA